VPPSAAEIKAVVKALEGEYPEDATSKDVALRVIQELDLVREKSDKWVTVLRIGLPGGEYHNFALGPFSTYKRAVAAGEQAMPNTMKYKREGDARFRAVPVANGEREAWESIHPEQINHQAYIQESVAQWSPSAWMEAVKEKSGWGHKPDPVKDQINKEEEHS
jgi:hypothetical protein